MPFDPIAKWRQRRPLVLLAVCLALGMAIGAQNAVPWPVWAGCAAAVSVWGCMKRQAVCIFAAALLAGAALVAVLLVRPAVEPVQKADIHGRLASEPVVREENTRLLLDDVTINGESAPYRVMIYLYGEPVEPLEYGMSLSLTANLSVPTDAGNPHGFDYAAWLWRQGAALSGTTSAENLTVIAPSEPSFMLWSLRCRAYLSDLVGRLYSEESAPLVRALLLGERSQLPEELEEDFRRSGLSHVLAISGLHVSCLALAIDRLLRMLRCPRPVSFALVMVLLIFYSAMIGFPASVVRAVLMYALSAAARMLGRPGHSLTGLSLALIVLLLINPLSISDASLILSFSAMAGILLLTRPLTVPLPARSNQWAYRFRRYILAPLSASLAAQLGVLPAVACLFNSLPTYSLLANLPALPLMTLLLPVSLLSVCVGAASPMVGQPLVWGVSGPLKGLSEFVSWVAELPGAVVSTPTWPAVLILAYAAVCLVCAATSGVKLCVRRLGLLLLPGLAALALMIPLRLPVEGLTITFLDVGQGDAALIRAENAHYLMDVGDGSTVADYLADTGIRPAAVFLSHPHDDHAGGLEQLVKLLEPTPIYIPCLWEEVEADEGVPEALDAARAAGWPVVELTAGDRVQLSPNVVLEVFQPWEGMANEANDVSLVAQVRYGAGSALFTGDLTVEGERAFLPDTDVMKVPHHGAGTSTSDLLLKMTSPSTAIISVGRNSYGHPTAETLGRLAGAGTQIFRTDQCGALEVTIQPDGSVEVSPFRYQAEWEDAA